MEARGTGRWNERECVGEECRIDVGKVPLPEWSMFHIRAQERRDIDPRELPGPRAKPARGAAQHEWLVLGPAIREDRRYILARWELGRIHSVLDAHAVDLVLA